MDAIRILQPSDRDLLADVYHDAVVTQAAGLYTNPQIQAWSQHGWKSDAIDQALSRGFGLASLATPIGPGKNSDSRGSTIEAFAILEPIDRLALLYCRGRSCRQGRSTALLESLETHAQQSGCRLLHTEASQLSRPLLERSGWQVESEETVLFAGVLFSRWRMIKHLSMPLF